MLRAGDYIRDVLAMTFLLIALGSEWDGGHESAAPDALVLVTLLSILSLALPYLSLASVLPHIATPARLEYVRLLANVPYLVVIVVTLVRAYQGGSVGAEIGTGRGIGLGVVLGIAGVVLAAQGRGTDPSYGPNGRAFWKATATVLAGGGVVLSLMSGALYVIEFAGEAHWGEIAVILLDLIFFAGIPVLTVRGLVRGDWVWRDVAIVLGAAGLLAALWAEGADQTMQDAWSLRLAGPQVLLWPAIGAAAAAPALTHLKSSTPSPETRVNLAGRLFQVAAVVAVMAFLIHGFRAVAEPDARSVYLTAVVVSLLILAIATLGRGSLVRQSGSRTPAAVGAAVAATSAAFLQLTVIGVAESTEIGFDVATIISTWFVCAVAILGMLLWQTPAAETETHADADTSRHPPEVAPQDDEPPAQDESLWEVNPDDEAESSAAAEHEQASRSP